MRRFKFCNERETFFMTSMRFSSCFITCAVKRESHTGHSTLEQENDTNNKLHGYSSRNYIYFREEKANKKWALEHECFHIHIVFPPRSWAQAKGFCTDSLLGKWSKGARVANMWKQKKKDGKIGGCVIRFAAATWDWCLLWLDSVRFVKCASEGLPWESTYLLPLNPPLNKDSLLNLILQPLLLLLLLFSDHFILLFLFFPFIFISWSLITLQYCSGFCHTLTWISHGFTCIPHPDPPHPSGSSQCTSPEHLYVVYTRMLSWFPWHPAPWSHRRSGAGKKIYSVLDKTCLCAKLVKACLALIFCNSSLKKISAKRILQTIPYVSDRVFYCKVKYRFWCLSTLDPDYMKSPSYTW